MKRLVYIGVIAEWMDIELLQKLGERHYVTLIGERRILLPGNVTHLGVLAYKDLPAEIATHDIGIIPFKRTTLTLDINNSKIYQYYACGLPVVSTLDNTASRDAGVLIAQSHEEFLDKVAMAHTIDRQRLIAIAEQHDWHKKAAAFQNLLLELVGAQQSVGQSNDDEESA